MVPKGHQVLLGPRVLPAFPASPGFPAQPSWDRLAPLAHRALRDHPDCRAPQVCPLLRSEPSRAGGTQEMPRRHRCCTDK